MGVYLLLVYVWLTMSKGLPESEWMRMNDFLLSLHFHFHFLDIIKILIIYLNAVNNRLQNSESSYTIPYNT